MPVSVNAPILRAHDAGGAGPASSAVVPTSRPRRRHAAAMKSRATLDARRPAGEVGVRIAAASASSMTRADCGHPVADRQCEKWLPGEPR
jgi:hypothetical protein